MEAAIRAANWIAAFALIRDAPEASDGFTLRLARSLWVHGRHIRQNLERPSAAPTTNHYLADLLGLLTIGCFLPELREARRWREFAWSELLRQTEVQILPDGVSYERSLPYHRLVLEMSLHGIALAGGAGLRRPDGHLQAVSRMLDVVRACTRPDGSLPQWGDNDDGRWLPLEGYAQPAPPDGRHLLALGAGWCGRGELIAAAADRDVEARWHGVVEGAPASAGSGTAASCAFPDAGLYVLRHDDLHASFSCGSVGTGGLGNHSHNDVCALTVWAAGVEWIPDPGTGSYTGDPGLRNRLRGTAAHATVQVGRLEQNPFGSGSDELFTQRERARPRALGWQAGGGPQRIEAEHDGFEEGGAGWTHRRSVTLDPARRLWRVDDRIARRAGSGRTEGEAPVVSLRWPTHPSVSVETVGDASGWPGPLIGWVDDARREGASAASRRHALLLRAGSERFWILLELPESATVGVEPGLHSPSYGVTLRCSTVTARWPCSSQGRATSWLWSPPAEGR
jgi:uncharacterized heparinase superfamily protein